MFTNVGLRKGFRTGFLVGSIGVLCWGFAALLGSLNPAKAQYLGPEVTGGSHPYVSWTGSVDEDMDASVFTVPANRILVVTGAISGFNERINLLQDDQPKVLGMSMAMSSGRDVIDSYGNIGVTMGGGMLAHGNGRVVFEPGTDLVVRGDNCYGRACHYFIQGYLAHP